MTAREMTHAAIPRLTGTTLVSRPASFRCISSAGVPTPSHQYRTLPLATDWTSNVAGPARPKEPRRSQTATRRPCTSRLGQFCRALIASESRGRSLLIAGIAIQHCEVTYSAAATISVALFEGGRSLEDAAAGYLGDGHPSVAPQIALSCRRGQPASQPEFQRKNRAGQATAATPSYYTPAKRNCNKP